jgi:hypothetical protein
VARKCAQSQKPQAAQWCETFKKIQAGEKGGVVTDSNGAASVSLVFAEKRLVQVLVQGKALKRGDTSAIRFIITAALILFPPYASD